MYYGLGPTITGYFKVHGMRKIKIFFCISLSPYSSFKGIEVLTQLYVLNLSHNNISRIDGLLNSHSLGELNLSNNNISDISGLPSLINLRVCNISNNKVSV